MTIYTVECSFHWMTKLPIPAGTGLSFGYSARSEGQISKRGHYSNGMNAVAKEDLTSHQVRVVTDGRRYEVFNAAQRGEKR